MALSKQVLGFYPSWLSVSAAQLRYDLLSTISWFGFSGNTGALIPDPGFPPTELISTAHANDVKVIFTINVGRTAAIDGYLSNPAPLIQNILSIITTNNFDGVDIDFEGIGATNSVSGLSNRTHLNEFFQSLSLALWAINPDYYIGADLPAVDWTNAWDVVTLQNYSTYMMIMTYDYHWISDSIAGSVAPLDAVIVGGPEPSVKNSIESYALLVPKNKLLMGIPYYGYKWPTVSDQKNANTTGAATAITYSEAIIESNQYGRIWDDIWKTPWYTYQQGSQWYQGHYDDTESIALKYDLCNEKQIAGIGIWALGYDAGALWNLIEQKFTCPNISQKIQLTT